MKFAFTLLIFLASLTSYANNLHCVSNSRAEYQVTVQGQVTQGTVLSVNVKNQDEAQQLDVFVKQIKPSHDHVEINGVAMNRLFIGGGQLKLQLILPFENSQPALLRTTTPSFNQDARTQEIPMDCSLQNLYQIPPNKPVLATM